MIKVEGVGGISAAVIKDSISPDGNRLTTFEFVFPRWILAEVNTHRMMSKNAASTRAVPIASVLSYIKENIAMPIHWGKNQEGMSAREELTGLEKQGAMLMWKAAAKAMIEFAIILSTKTGINGHKQWVGRLIENFTFTKQIISGTEWPNFYWLRDHLDAQPEFRELARCAREAQAQSTPELLLPGQWHLPYIVRREDDTYWIDEETNLDLETAKIVSVSCCAQVSYRKLDDSVEKAQKIYKMLNVGSTTQPCHAVPLEHVATPMAQCDPDTEENVPTLPYTWEPGITHMRKDRSLWSGNFKGWIQQRQLISNEAVWS